MLPTYVPPPQATDPTQERSFRRSRPLALVLPRRTVLTGLLATMAMRPMEAVAAPGDYAATYSDTY